MADTRERKKEGVTSSLSSSGKEMENGEPASKLKNARRGKLIQLTKRKNIMLQLMEDVSGIQEVQENLQRYNNLLGEFNAVHKAYQEQLTEDDVVKDECEWYQPKMTEINDFLSLVSEWLTGASKADKAEPQEEDEILPKDSISQVSHKSGRSKASSVRSARICAEAERAAIMIKAAALKERHDLETKESELQKEIQTLKQKREAFELKTQLAISSFKLAVFHSAEEPQGSSVFSPTVKPPGDELPAGPTSTMQAADTQVKVPEEILQNEGKDSMNVYLAETSMKSATAESQFLSLDKITQAISTMQTPSVRPKEGVKFQSLLTREGEDFSIKGATSSPLDLQRKSDSSKTANNDQSKVSSNSNSNEEFANILQRQNDITSFL